MAQPDMGTAEAFRGQASDVCFSQSPWFNCEEIPPDSWGGYVVQIEEVRARRGVKFNKGKARERELFLKFVGIDKELRVNVTIRRVLDDTIGPMCADWFGKRITLFVQGGIDTSEGKKNGVRVRPNLPPQAAPKQAAPAAKPAPVEQPPVTAPTDEPPHAPGLSAAEQFCADARVELGAFKKAATPAEFDALLVKAGVKGKQPATLTTDDWERINSALPAPFHISL